MLWEISLKVIKLQTNCLFRYLVSHKLEQVQDEATSIEINHCGKARRIQTSLVCKKRIERKDKKNHTEGSELQVIHTGLSVSKLQACCVTISGAKFGTTIAHRQFISEITATSQKKNGWSFDFSKWNICSNRPAYEYSWGSLTFDFVTQCDLGSHEGVSLSILWPNMT